MTRSSMRLPKPVESRDKPSFVILVLFAAMFLDAVAVPGFGVPVSSAAAGLAVIYAFIAPQRVMAAELAGRPRWLFLTVMAIPIWLAATSVLNGDPDFRRLLNIGVFAAVILVLGGLRLDARTVCVGLGVAVVFGVAAGILLLPRSSYAGRMTGPMGDPNSAGLLIVVLSALALPGFRRRKSKVGLLLVAALGIFSTQSRTSMLAVLIMVLWVLLNRFFSAWFSIPFVAGALIWVSSIADALAGDAFQERAGSDALRDRIFQVELQQVEIRPWVGQGAGTAAVSLDGQHFFFHNSYLALRAEAGWIGLGLVILLFVAVFISLLRIPRDQRNLYFEASLIGVTVCALNLGEVLLALPAAFALGLSAHHVLKAQAAAKRPTRKPKLVVARRAERP